MNTKKIVVLKIEERKVASDTDVKLLTLASCHLFQMSRAAASSQRLRELLPVVREYTPQLREFGTLLGVRLSEKALSRGLNWASSRLVRA